MPKVSVIMGVYNCEKYLDEAIISILNQTYKDWELIVCDDDSADNTYCVAQKYQRKIPEKIVLLKNDKNMGLNYTLNKCLKFAKGEYIARMDGDDISLPDRFEKQVKFLDENPEYGFVSGSMRYFDGDNEWERNFNIEKPTKKDVFLKGCFCHAPSMLRRYVYDDVGGYTENKRLLRVEDFNLWHKIYAHGYKGYNLQDVIYKMKDDHSAYKRRTLKAYLNGTYAMCIAFKHLDVPWYYFIYIVKEFLLSIFKSIIPEKLYMYFHLRNTNIIK